jgi:GxxExxY protein
VEVRDPRTYGVIGAAMAVHRELGSGFLEAVYQEALEVELQVRKVPYQREVELPVSYRGHRLSTSYRADFICYGETLLELKAIQTIGRVERAQLLNYLKITGFKLGLLINFGAESLEYERLVL